MLKTWLIRTSAMALMAGLSLPVFAQSKPEAVPPAEAVDPEESKAADAALDKAREALRKAEAEAARAAAEAQNARMEAIRAEQNSALGRVRRARAQLREEQQAAIGKYWIGVGSAPIPAVVAAQLGLPENVGLAVEDVIPESPAAKAGLAKNDILTVVGERKLQSLQDLIEAIQATEGKEVSITFYRGGKEQTARITPADRPKEHFAASEDARFELEFKHPQELNVQFVQPGVVFARRSDLPKELTISITRKDKEPPVAEGTIDGKPFKATLETVDELPPSVREHVRSLLSGGPQLLMGRMPPMSAKSIKLPTHSRAVESPSIDQQLEDIQKKIDGLQKAIESLQKARKAEDKSGASAESYDSVAAA